MSSWHRPSAERVELTFSSLPPSVNHLYGKSRKYVYISTKARAWQRHAGAELNIQKPGRVVGTYSMTIELSRPDNRRRDASNYVKTLEDLLVRHGVVDDDSLAQSVTSKWVTSDVACRVVVEAAP